ncbi:MAG: DUF2304 family protein [Candidatus Eisenbacteria bacterium]|nr:DUF2304 family protein [Candidatus Eisenbacteria bacterium]
MEIAQGLIAAVGVSLAAVAFLLGRAERLSSGHGVTYLLLGLVLAVAGLLGPTLGRWLLGAGGPMAALFCVTLVLLPLLLGLLLYQAVTLTGLRERLLRTAQEVALLRSALAEGAADRKDAATDSEAHPD